MGHLEAILGYLEAILEAFGQKSGCSEIVPPLLGSKNRLFRPSWDALGVLLRALGAVLEPLWTSQGRLLGDLEDL